MADLDLRGSIEPTFWQGRRVFLTGHTGFKGAWLALWLTQLGALVQGYALPPLSPSFFDISGVGASVEGTIGDIVDRALLERAVDRARPDIVVHFAAEALVRRAFQEPARCFSTNVMGTVGLFEALRNAAAPTVMLVATTDKVYRNDERGIPFDERAALGGSEPYAASKVAQEMVARAYGDSLFEPRGIRVATARAGNVVGGGDFGQDRLIPDLLRAHASGQTATIRYPQSTRPWQHVLDCLAGYLLYIQRLAVDAAMPRALNIGPKDGGTTVAEVADRIGAELGRPELWTPVADLGPAEARSLSLDTSLARRLLGWSPVFTCEEAIRETANWHRHHLSGGDMQALSLASIQAYTEALS